MRFKIKIKIRRLDEIWNKVVNCHFDGNERWATNGRDWEQSHVHSTQKYENRDDKDDETFRTLHSIRQ